MITEDYLRRSHLFRRLKNGPHGHIVQLYAARLIKDEFAVATARRRLKLLGDLFFWVKRCGLKPTDIDEDMSERYLKCRAGKRSIQPSDRPAIKRLLSVLRDAGMISPAPATASTPEDRIVAAFSDYLRQERGLATSTIINHQRFIRDFLREVCPAGDSDLGNISHETVVRYFERHARDGSVGSGMLMRWSVRAFLQYLHVKGLTQLALADCVPSIRQWKFATLPTYLSVAEVQKVLDGCDRTIPVGRRDYAILMLLAKLGLRAGEVATLTLDDIDWRSGQMLIHAKGRKQARLPMPPDVGAAIVAYLRDGYCPTSSCRRLFLRAPAPHVGFVSGSAITTIAKNALARAGIRGYAHHGAHIFRHSLATELLRSGATLLEIGQLLGHERHDTTRIYAKVDFDRLRSLSLPWLGGVQ
jgi:site-specific recombinase XerD